MRVSKTSERKKSTLNNLINRKNEKVQDQEQLEKAIIQYQEARTDGSEIKINEAYAAVCAIYDPLSFVRHWFKKYRYLYDTREDFIQDYLRVFVTSLAAWQPRHLRKASRYEGKGDFKNFFWSALSHNYINMVKSDASGKRNLSMRCPMCDVWCNPLSTHLLKCHGELLWDQMATFGHIVENLHTCPFCKSHKVPRNIVCPHDEVSACAECRRQVEIKALKKHLLSMHSTYLFERFRQLHPSYATLSPKPSSVNISDDSEDGEELNVYDLIPDQSPGISKLLLHGLSEIQTKIVYKVLNGSTDISFDSALYNCDEREFASQLEDLKNRMSLCGIEG